MKQEITRKELYQNWGKEQVIIVPACVCDISRFFKPSFYWAGVFGWNCDIYVGRDHAYTYGDRPCGTEIKDGTKDLKAKKAFYLSMMKCDGVEKR